MTEYLLSTHSVEGQSRPPMTPEQMQESFQEILALEAEMKSAGAYVFGGGLHGPGTATVVRVADGQVITTDGPFAESKEQLAGIYIVEADDLDAALTWAARTAALIRQPIEVRPFRQMPVPGAAG
jgi:hypothetical protein